MIFSIDTEQAVLGGLLLDNDAFDRLGALQSEHFYRADHRAIFTEIRRLIETGQGADVVTVGHTLQAAGSSSMGYLHDLASNTPSAANIGRYSEIVQGYAQRRALIELAKDVQEEANDGDVKDTRKLLDRAQSTLENIAQQRAKSEPVKASDDMPRYLAELDRRAKGEAEKAIPTGFADLDKKLMGGIRRGDLVIVAARPKMGKSAFAMNVALNAAPTYSVLALSMEMPKDQIHDRNVAVIGSLPLRKVIDPRGLNDSDWNAIQDACEKIKTMNLFMDDQGGLTLMDVRMKARAIKRRHGLDLLVIDYLQLMEGEGKDRNAQIEGITRGLKAFAKEMDIGIILLSQLNRMLEQRPNKRPMPSDLRDSGAIEQDCDIALFLYRDEVYHEFSQDKGICEVNVGLIRQGEPGTVALRYVAYQTKFQNLEQGRTFGQHAKTPKYSELKD